MYRDVKYLKKFTNFAMEIYERCQNEYYSLAKKNDEICRESGFRVSRNIYAMDEDAFDGVEIDGVVVFHPYSWQEYLMDKARHNEDKRIRKQFYEFYNSMIREIKYFIAIDYGLEPEQSYQETKYESITRFILNAPHNETIDVTVTADELKMIFYVTISYQIEDEPEEPEEDIK